MKDNFWSVVNGLRNDIMVPIDPDGDGLRNIGDKFYSEKVIRNPLVCTVRVKKRKVSVPHNASRPKKRKLGGN